jgi:hypothetical protein
MTENIDKIVLKSFWNGLYTHPMYNEYRKYFAQVLEDILKYYDKAEIYSIFEGEKPSEGDKEKNKNILYVQYSGEGTADKDHDLYDINLVPGVASMKPLIIPLTLGGQHLYVHDLWNRLYAVRNYDLDHNPKNKPGYDKFCCFIVSNGNPYERRAFYSYLNQYRKVDSCGHFNNTIGYLLPEFDTEPYYEFIEHYKFMICFENQKRQNYFTEKLINAYIAKTIPIYWGCPNVPDFLNLDAIIYIDTFDEESIRNSINRIVELDQDPEKYKKVYEQPLFKNNEIPDELSQDYIRKMINRNYEMK